MDLALAMLAPTKLEVRQCVSRAVAVDVVDRLFRCQWPAQSPSYHKSMLHDVASNIAHGCERRIRLHVYLNISPLKPSPSLPISMPLAAGMAVLLAIAMELEHPTNNCLVRLVA